MVVEIVLIVLVYSGQGLKYGVINVIDCEIYITADLEIYVYVNKINMHDLLQLISPDYKPSNISIRVSIKLGPKYSKS